MKQSIKEDLNTIILCCCTIAMIICLVGGFIFNPLFFLLALLNASAIVMRIATRAENDHR